MKDHEEDLDEDSDDSSFNCRKCDFQSKNRTQLVDHLKIKHDLYTCSSCNVTCISKNELDTHIIEHHKSLKCNQCGESIVDRNKLKEHMIESHKSYKPCTKYKNDNCNEVPCRFNHIILQANEEICYRCETRFRSKTDLIKHIKEQHGNIVCHKFIQNKCERSSEECIFSHCTKDFKRQAPLNIQQDFPQSSPIPLHSPHIKVSNMSTKIQSQLQLQSPQVKGPYQVDVMNMIPQIVAQVVAALTMQLK